MGGGELSNYRRERPPWRLDTLSGKSCGAGRPGLQDCPGLRQGKSRDPGTRQPPAQRHSGGPPGLGRHRSPSSPSGAQASGGDRHSHPSPPPASSQKAFPQRRRWSLCGLKARDTAPGSRRSSDQQVLEVGMRSGGRAGKGCRTRTCRRKMHSGRCCLSRCRQTGPADSESASTHWAPTVCTAPSHRRAQPRKEGRASEAGGLFQRRVPPPPAPALSPHLAGRHTRWEKHCWEDCAESPREVRPGRKPRIWYPSPCCTAGNEAQRREISFQVRRGVRAGMPPSPQPQVEGPLCLLRACGRLSILGGHRSP